MLKLTMLTQLAEKYEPLLAWNGWLAVDCCHPPATYTAGPADLVELSEVGVLVNWRGEDPTGVLLPWSEVIAIRQVPDPG